MRAPTRLTGAATWSPAAVFPGRVNFRPDLKPAEREMEFHLCYLWPEALWPVPDKFCGTKFGWALI